MLILHPFKITKNQSYALFFSAWDYQGNKITATTFTVKKVSKDGAVANTLSNSPTHIGDGLWTVTLTADETNADVLHIIFFGNAANYMITTHRILTSDGSDDSGGGSGISLTDVIDAQASLPGGDITVEQVFQLLAKRIKRNGHKI